MSNYSPKLPLLIDAANGFQNNQTVLEVVSQNLKMILLTSQGERVMDPLFGVGMKRFLFEQNNEFTYSNIKAKIKKQVKQYMPYIEIEDVIFSSEANDSNISANHLLVTVKFYITATGAVSSLTVQV